MKAKKNFFQRALEDMKDSAAAQHRADKAQFEAVKAESRAQWEEARLFPGQQMARRQAELDEQIQASHARMDEANKRAEAARQARGK